MLNVSLPDYNKILKFASAVPRQAIKTKSLVENIQIP